MTWPEKRSTSKAGIEPKSVTLEVDALPLATCAEIPAKLMLKFPAWRHFVWLFFGMQGLFLASSLAWISMSVWIIVTRKQCDHRWYDSVLLNVWKVLSGFHLGGVGEGVGEGRWKKRKKIQEKYKKNPGLHNCVCLLPPRLLVSIAVSVSGQGGFVALRKAHKYSTLSLSSLPKRVVFVLVFFFFKTVHNVCPV